MRPNWKTSAAVLLLVISQYAEAKPLLQSPLEGVCANKCWDVYPDDHSASLFYLFPDRYEISRDQSGRAQATRQYSPQGDLIIDFWWAPTTTTVQEEQALLELLRKRFEQPFLTVLAPQILALRPGPGLENTAVQFETNDPIEDEAPGSPIHSTLRVPKKSLKAWLSQVTLEGGFLASLSLQWQDTFMERTLVILGGARLCEILPELECGYPRRISP